MTITTLVENSLSLIGADGWFSLAIGWTDAGAACEDATRPDAAIEQWNTISDELKVELEEQVAQPDLAGTVARMLQRSF